MTDAATIVLAVCGGIGTVTTALGIVWWLLKPRIQDWAEEQIIKPVRETHHQVTVNHHSSDEPTVMDRLSDIAAENAQQARQISGLDRQVGGLDRKMGGLDRKMTALAYVLDQHLRRGDDPLGDQPDLD